MKIIKYKKISSNKYKIYFDNNSIILYENVILKYNLLLKKEIDERDLIEINEENFRESIYDTALKFIDTRVRSKKEIIDYLRKKKYELNDIDEVIIKLENNGLIDDNYFCKCFVNDKINLSNYGIDKIKNELLKYGIDDSIINSELYNINKSIFEDKLNKIIDKEIKLNNKLPINKLKSKVINKCLNLGYNIEDVNEILNNIKLDSNSDINKDYTKIYNKYKNKYDEYKLDSVIKSKLYQKGYSIEEINKII